MVGISFGSKKNSTTGTSVIDKNVDEQSNQLQTGSQQSTANTVGTTTNASNLVQNQSGVQQQDQSQSQTGTNRTTGTTNSLSSDLVSGVEGKVQSILSTGFNDENFKTLSNGINGRDDFNVDEFVSNTVGVARNRGEQLLQEQGSAFSSGIGGSAGGNSMAALMAQRGRNDLETNLAGISSSARAQGEGIVNENLATAGGLQNVLTQAVSGLVGGVKGANQTIDTTQLSDQISQLLGNTTNSSSGGQSATSTGTESKVVDQLLSTIQEMIGSSSQKTQGTEDTLTKNKAGGGFSLSL